MSWISNPLGENTDSVGNANTNEACWFLLELAWFSSLPGCARLFCQLSIPQILKLFLRYCRHCGSLCMWKLRLRSCISAADPPCCKCRIPRLAECGAAGALGVKQSYWAMAALSDCLEMHNSSYMVFFLLSFTFLYISICFVPTYWIK